MLVKVIYVTIKLPLHPWASHEKIHISICGHGTKTFRCQKIYMTFQKYWSMFESTFLKQHHFREIKAHWQYPMKLDNYFWISTNCLLSRALSWVWWWIHSKFQHFPEWTHDNHEWCQENQPAPHRNPHAARQRPAKDQGCTKRFHLLGPCTISCPPHIKGGEDFHYCSRDLHNWRTASDVWCNATMFVHNHTFTIELMVAPKQCLKTSVMMWLSVKNPWDSLTWTWACATIPYCLGRGAKFHGPLQLLDSRMYTAAKNSLNKQPWAINDNNIIIRETFPSEALNPVKYMKADLKQIAQGWTDLTRDHQSKLILVLKEHETLFLGKQGNWKEQPVIFEVTEGTTPIWA